MPRFGTERLLLVGLAVAFVGYLILLRVSPSMPYVAFLLPTHRHEVDDLRLLAPAHPRGLEHVGVRSILARWRARLLGRNPQI